MECVLSLMRDKYARLRAAEQRPNPAHALGGCLGMVAELLRHPASAAIGTELPHGDPDRLSHNAGGWRIRSLQAGGEQRPAPGVVHVQAGWRSASSVCGAGTRITLGLVAQVSRPFGDCLESY